MTNVSIKTTDAGDASLADEKFLKCTHYKVKGQRNVLTFPLKMLKVLNDLFKLTQDYYDIPPVIAIDTGAIVKTFFIDFYLNGTGDDPVNDVEDKCEDLMHFIDTNTWMADHCFINIGTHLTNDWSSFELLDNYTEGKITDYEFEWDERDPKRIKGNLNFMSCHELDWF